MRAIVFDQHGGPEVLDLREVHDPVADSPSHGYRAEWRLGEGEHKGGVACAAADRAGRHAVDQQVGGVHASDWFEEADGSGEVRFSDAEAVRVARPAFGTAGAIGSLPWASPAS